MQSVKTLNSDNPIKKFNKYIEELNKYNTIDMSIDPYEEEEWDELENGDIIFNMNNFMKINFEVYNVNNNISKYKKLTRNYLVKEIIKIRNRLVNSSTINIENIFRTINKKEKEFENKLNLIFKHGNVENSNRNVILSDIKNNKISNFTIYYINKTPCAIDRYEVKSTLPFNESDWWSDVEKYKNDIRLSLDQKTHNIECKAGGCESLGKMLYYSELEKMVNDNEIILESTNVKHQIQQQIHDTSNIEVKTMYNKLDTIYNDLTKYDKMVSDKIKMVEHRFPEIKLKTF